MSFETEGFRGKSGFNIKNEQIEKYSDLFNLADNCSQGAMKIAALLPYARRKPQLAAGLLFARGLSHFQAAITLAESGMTIEALVLCRGLVETGLVICALSENAVTTEELVSHDMASRKKIANSLLHTNAYPSVALHSDKLRSFVADNESSTIIDMHEFARRGKALALYDGLYRHLSHYAAHPSLSAADSYLVDPPNDSPHAKFRPILEFTPRAVISACAGLLVCCYACDKLEIRTPETNTITTELWKIYESLYLFYEPWK
jgi:hypothetical protein